MRKIIFIFLGLFISLAGYAQGRLIAEADAAYMADDFEKAKELYTEILHKEGSSSQLYFNLGNTYYRLGELGKAILYYRKSLKLDPTNSDARANLEFVETKTIDRQEDNRSLVTRVTENIIFTMTPNGWSIAALMLFFFLLGCIGTYVLTNNIKFRKLSFFGGLIILILDTLVLIVAFRSSSLVKNNNEGIVITPSVQLSSVPRIPKDKSEQAFMLHEGAHFEIIDSLTVTTDSLNPKWLEIKIDDVHRAWIPEKDVERI